MKISRYLGLGIFVVMVVMVVLVTLALGRVLGIGLGIVFGAQGPAMIEQPRLALVTALPVYDQGGELVSFHATAKFTVMELQPSGKRALNVVSVDFDLVTQGHQALNVKDGQMATLADCADDLMAASVFYFKLARPDPLPTNPAPLVERKTLRAKASR